MTPWMTPLKVDFLQLGKYYIITVYLHEAFKPNIHIINIS